MITHKTRKGEQPLMHVTHCLDLNNMPTKYYQNISNDIQVIEHTSFCLRMDRRTYLQEGRSEVPNGLWTLQIYGVTPHNLNPTNLF